MSRTGSLRGYILIRIALMVPMVWVLLTVVFLMMRVAPGDPVSATLGGRLSPAELDERRASLGLDRPILVHAENGILGVGPYPVEGEEDAARAENEGYPLGRTGEGGRR